MYGGWLRNLSVCLMCFDTFGRHVVDISGGHIVLDLVKG